MDLCRDALVVILSAHLEHDLGAASKINEKDLAELISALPEDKRLFKSTADVVCKLHPRGKSNEQFRRGTRDVTDTDGMLAVEALGFVLRDLEWAR